jgi:hypothetical protein
MTDPYDFETVTDDPHHKAAIYEMAAATLAVARKYHILPNVMLALQAHAVGTTISYLECSSNDAWRAVPRDVWLELVRANVVEGADHKPDGWEAGKPGKQDG